MPASQRGHKRKNLTQGARHQLAVTAALFVFLLGVYTLSITGEFRTRDGEYVFRVTRSVVEQGTVAVPCEPEFEGWQYRGHDGRCYAVFGLAQSLAIVPLYLVGWAAEARMPGLSYGELTHFTSSLLNPLVTALWAVLVYAWARRLTGERPALLTALLFGLGSLAWPYTRFFFAEPLTGLGLTLCGYGLYRFGRDGDDAGAPLAAAGAGLALLTRVSAASAAPALGFYGALQLARRWRDGRRPTVRSLVAAGLVLAAFVGLLALYNWARWGHPLESGYRADYFQYPPMDGLRRLTYGSGRGILWYMPLVAATAYGLRHLWRRGLRGEVVLIAGAFLGYAWVHGQWFSWMGGTTWGPRFLVPTVGFLALPWAAALHHGSAAERRLTLGLGALSILVQFLGVGVDFFRLGDFGVEESRTWHEWRYSPLWGHLQILLREGPSDLALFNGGRLPLGAVAQGALASAAAAGAVVGGLKLRTVLRATVASGAGQSGGGELRRLPGTWAVAIAAIAVGTGLLAARSALAAEPPETVLRLAPGGTDGQSLGWRYAGELELMGYRLAPTRPEPGWTLEVGTWWQILRQPTLPYRMYIHLAEPGSTRPLTQRDPFLGGQTFPTTLWPPGRMVEVRQALPLPAGLPAPGVYELRLGLYDPRTGSRPPVEHGAGPPPDVVGPVVVAAPPPRPPEVSLAGVRLGDFARLEGYSLERLGGRLRLTLYWRPSGPAPTNLTTFVHLVAEAGRLAAQADAQPFGGRYPTSRWTAGELLADRYVLRLPAGEEGRYAIWVGMYELSTLERVPLRGPPELRIEGDALRLAEIEVPD